MKDTTTKHTAVQCELMLNPSSHQLSSSHAMHKYVNNNYNNNNNKSTNNNIGIVSIILINIQQPTDNVQKNYHILSRSDLLPVTIQQTETTRR